MIDSINNSVPWAGISATGPILRPAEAARYLGYSQSHYWALAKRGLVPVPLKLGSGHNGASGVPRPWLDAIIAAAASEGGRS